MVYGCLNSKLIIQYVNSIDTKVGTIAYRHYKYNFEKITIPKVTERQHKLFSYVVSMVIDGQNSGKNTQDLESQIDLMVYKLYELDYAEAKLIDPDLDSVLASFGLSAQDFERMTIEQLGKLSVR
jgi:hypothetical protein